MRTCHKSSHRSLIPPPTTLLSCRLTSSPPPISPPPPPPPASASERTALRAGAGAPAEQSWKKLGRGRSAGRRHTIGPAARCRAAAGGKSRPRGARARGRDLRGLLSLSPTPSPLSLCSPSPGNLSLRARGRDLRGADMYKNRPTDKHARTHTEYECATAGRLLRDASPVAPPPRASGRRKRDRVGLSDS